MNAAERFFAASRAHDVGAALTELAPDVVMLNPASDEPIVGKPAVAGVLQAVQTACDEFRHTHLLVGDSPVSPRLYGLVFEATIGTAKLRGVDLVEVDERDLIVRFDVVARPIGTLMALASRMGSGPSRA
jgi:hypothetical protein